MRRNWQRRPKKIKCQFLVKKYEIKMIKISKRKTSDAPPKRMSLSFSAPASISGKAMA
jgi:hypothetical protein